MTLFRTVTYFHALFSVYYYNDFLSTFLVGFIKECEEKLTDIGYLCTNDANTIIERIIELMNNVKKR